MDYSKDFPSYDLSDDANLAISKLSDLEYTFIKHYLERCNGNESAKKTGFPCGSVAMYLKRPRVLKALRAITGDLGLNPEIFSCLLVDNLGVDLADFEPLITGEMGLMEFRDHGGRTDLLEGFKRNRFGEIEVKLTPKIKWAELAAKVLGMTVERYVIKSEGDNLSQLTLEELQRRKRLLEAKDE